MTPTKDHRTTSALRSTRAVVVVLLALASSGCFRYTPADVNATPPGQGVRVLLTRQGAAEFTAVTDRDEAVSTLNGEVVRTEGSDLLLDVAVGQRQTGFVASNINQTIRIPVDEILSFERRELDVAATSLLVGGSAAVAGLIIAFILDARRDTSDPDPIDPPELRLDVGLFSIPFGIGN